MTSDRNSTHRRAFLASVAAAGVGLAGCNSIGSTGPDNSTDSATETPTDTPVSQQTETKTDEPSEKLNKQPNDPGTHKPMNPKAATFEDLSYWTEHAGVAMTADTNTVYQGSQSARIEGRSGSIQREFPIPINLENKDISLAMKIEGPIPTTMRIWLYDTGGNKTRLLQFIHGKQTSGWVRINPSINAVNADMTSIQKILITIDGPGQNKKYWVDDIHFHDKTTNKGQVMFSFDFITRSIYEIAYPMMKEAGIKGTVAVPADNVGNAGRLTYDELKELQNDGWEITSMTNDWEPLYGQSKDIQRARMERAIRLIEGNGLGRPGSVMYPKGFCDATSLEVAEELHDLAFVRYNASEAGLSQSAIMGPNFVNRSDPGTPHAVENQVQPAIEYNGLYNLVLNDIGPDANTSRSEFRQMVDVVARQKRRGNVEIVTPSDVVLK